MKRIRESFELQLKPFGNRLNGSLIGHGLIRVDEDERDADETMVTSALSFRSRLFLFFL